MVPDRADMQAAFLLHTRPYRDTSLILDCLTHDFGRIPLVVRGARSKRSRQRQYCQPFRPLLLSWQGRGNMKTLTQIELRPRATGDPENSLLHGEFLYCGFYLNELLTRLLVEADACPEVYDLYVRAWSGLCRGQDMERVLREFEFALVAELGFAIDLQRESVSGEAIQADRFYRLVAEQGLVESTSRSEATIAGSELLAVARGDYLKAQTRRAAKQLTRWLLQPLLGDKPLKSRELFRSQRSKQIP